jgi:hypothetical protein
MLNLALFDYKYKFLQYTLYLPAVTLITTVKINHLPQNQQERTTSKDTPFTLQYVPINCTNEISFISTIHIPVFHLVI